MAENHGHAAAKKNPDPVAQGPARLVGPISARWIRDAARAVHYAHEMGVVHRDVKPSNLLLDDRGSIWVTDFGLARTMVDESMTLTSEGELVGTFAYMSPEQVSGDRLMLDHRTDIYSLGVTLYELLTREKPFGQESRTDVLYRVLHEEPRAPRAIDRSIPRDLETIVLAAMAKVPDDRYQTAAEMADDLDRFLRNEPVRARRPTLVRRSAKWVGRNRALAATMAACASCLVLLAAVGWWSAYALKASSERLRDALEVSNRHLYVADVRLAGDALSDENNPNVELSRERLGRHFPEPGEPDQRGFAWHYLWQKAHPAERTLVGHAGAVWCVAWSPDSETIASAGEDGTLRLWHPDTGRCRRIISAHEAPARYLCYAPDGNRLATVGEDGKLRVWDAQRGKLLFELLAHEPGCYAAAWSPDGKQIATCGDETPIKLWDAETLEQVDGLDGHAFDVKHVVFSPDGRWLVSAGNDKSVGLWDLRTFEAVEFFRVPHKVGFVSFAPDGRQFSAAAKLGHILTWELASRRETARWNLHDQPIYSIAHAPDGKVLAAASKDRLVRLVDAESGGGLRVLPGHSGRVYSLAFSRDSRRLVTAGRDGEIKLWQVDRVVGDRVERALDVTLETVFPSFSHDGRYACIPDADGPLSLVDTTNGGLEILRGEHLTRMVGVEFAADGRWLVSARGAVIPFSSEDVSYTHLQAAEAIDVDFDGDGDLDRVAAIGPHRRIVWQERTEGGRLAPANAAYLGTNRSNDEYLVDIDGDGDEDIVRAFARDGRAFAYLKGGDGSYRRTILHTAEKGSCRIVAVGDFDGDARAELVAQFEGQPRLALFRDEGNKVFKLDRTLSIPSQHPEWFVAADLDSDGRTDLAGTYLGTGSLVWYRNLGGGQFESGRTLADGLVKPNFIAAEDVNGDTQLDLLTTSADEVIWLRNLGDGRFARPERFTTTLGAIPFLKPLGSEAAVWDTRTRRLVTTLKHQVMFAQAVAVSGDGRSAAVAGDDGVTRIWRLPGGEFLSVVPSYGTAVYDLEYAPDGNLLAITAGDHVVLWDLVKRRERTLFEGHESTVKRVCFSPNGKILATLSDDLTVRLWDTATGDLQRILVGHEARSSAGCFSSDGKTLVTGDRDGVVKLWDVDLGQELLTLGRCPGVVKALSFRGEGTLLALASHHEEDARTILCTWSVDRD